MRRIGLVLVVAVCAAMGLGSCGEESRSPLDDALAMLPADTPFALAVSTDLDSDPFRDLDAALQRFGIEGGLEGSLEELSAPEEGISFARDVRPLLGNELVVGIPSFGGGLGEEAPPFVAALRVSDGAAARGLLSDLGLEEIDEVGGASVYGTPPPKGAPEAYESEGPSVAVDDDLLVAAESKRGLEQALAQREADDRLTEDVFRGRLGGLPSEGILRVTGDAPSVLESLGIEETATVPWVKSLRSYGVVANVAGRTLAIDAAVSGDGVAQGDLPLDPGPRSPRVLRERPSVATRDQAQTIEFALAAVRAAVPQVAFEEVTDRLESELNGSVSSLVEQFGEGLVAELAHGRTVTRSVVGDPAVVAKALQALRDEVPLLARLSSSPGVAAEALDTARFAIPALPVPDEQFFPGRSTVKEIPGIPDLYRLRAPAPRPLPSPRRGSARPAPPGIAPIIRRFRREEFVYGLLHGAFVTAPSVKAAREAADATPIEADLPPGALAIRIPVDSADLHLPGPGGVTVTTIEAGIEASKTGLRLHAEAGL